MEEKKRIINLLTIINEEYRKNDKKVFDDYLLEAIPVHNLNLLLGGN